MSARVYPFRTYEKVLASTVLCGALIGFVPTVPTINATEHDHGWQVCIAIGFIPSWQKCWWFPDKPKTLHPDVPTCDIYGPCQA